MLANFGRLLHPFACSRLGSSVSWSPDKKRSGALAMKVGMLPIWDQWGRKHAATVLQLDECQVVQVKTEAVEGYNAVQLGVGEAKRKNTTKPLLKHFEKAGVNSKRELKEFRVSRDALLPVGTLISSGHFVPGQKVDVQGVSKGKGFQGVMKRWGFAGQSASHGNSRSHRVPGSTGTCQDPGRVWKNKKMPGRMGGENVTIAGLMVYKIELDRNLVFIKGAVPGPNGSFVSIKDSRKQAWNVAAPPPFPTCKIEECEARATIVEWESAKGSERRLEIVAPRSDKDPFDYEDMENPFQRR